MFRKAIVFFIVLSFLFVIPGSIKAENEKVSSKEFFINNIVSIKGADDIPFLFVSTNNETLFIIKNNDEIFKIDLNGYGIIRKMDYIKKSKLVVAGTSMGYLLFIDSYLLKIVDAVKIFDGEIYLLDATNSGSHLVLAARKSMTVSGKRVTAEALIVYDLKRRIVTFLRDWNSPDKLAKVFKLKISDDDQYLIVETLDSFCEFCEILDAKTEIYKLDTMEKIYSKSLGLAVSMDTWGSLKVISIRRWLRAKGYITEVHVIQVSNGEVDEKKFTLEFSSKIVKFAGPSKFILFLANEVKNKIGYFYNLNGYKLGEIKGDSVAVVNSYRDLIIIATSTRVFCYNYDMKLLWSIFLGESGKPIFANCYAGGEYVYVVFLNKLIIFARKLRYSLAIILTDIDKKPIEKATILITDKNGAKIAEGLTNQYGVFKTYLNGGSYKIILQAYQYINKTFDIELKEDITLRVTLEKVNVQKPINEIFIKVLNEKEEPLDVVWLNISNLNGEILNELVITGGGVKLILADGKYNFTVWANNYHTESKIIELPYLSNEIVFHLKPMRYNLTICILNATVINCSVQITNLEDFTEYSGKVNGTNACIVFTNLTHGLYEIKISAKGFYNATQKILLDSNKNYSIPLKKRVQKVEKPSSLNVSDVISFFEQKFYISKITNGKTISFEAESIEGKQIDFDNLRGKIIILEFFYTQCEGCKYVIPYLKQIEEKYGDNVKIFSITVSPADTLDVLNVYAQEHNITWTILRDEKGIYQLYNITVFPTILVLDTNRTLVYRVEGAALEIEQSRERVLSLITQASIIVRQYPDYVLLVAGILLFIIGVAMQYLVISALEGKEYEEDEREEVEDMEIFDFDIKW